MFGYKTHFRFSAFGKQIGLDWSKHSDGLYTPPERLELFKQARMPKSNWRRPKVDPDSPYASRGRRDVHLLDTCAHGHEWNEPGARTKSGKCVICSRRWSRDAFLRKQALKQQLAKETS